MSTSINKPTKEQRSGQHLFKDAGSDVCSIKPMLPFLELASRNVAVAPTLTLRKRNSVHVEDNGFAMASYNSAFLEGLFDDLAAKSPEVPVVDDEDVEVRQGENLVLTRAKDQDPKTTLSVAVPSDHNLSKRRRVSTNKSLGHCGDRSRINLTSFASSFVRSKKSSVLLSSLSPTKTLMPKKELLPATVSASYSFTLDMALQEQARPEEVNGEKNQQEDFGWFVDMDDQEDYGVKSLATPSSTSMVPLAFTAPTSPLAQSQDAEAEVEWAQAADTVDEVLGDFF